MVLVLPMRFDAVPLRLRAGENEVLLAIGESFGGWGVQAVLEGAEGVRVVPEP